MSDCAPGIRILPEVPTVQNTVRFYEQILAQGYPDPDLRRLRAACGAAQSLFTGHMHASGKPYLAHCVGAAGALAALASPADLIAAALVHDAYRLGDFGPWRPLLSQRRRHLQRALGATAEAHVRRYQELGWSTADLAGFADGARAPLDRDALLIGLACELDDLRDRGALYCADAEARRDRIRRLGPALVRIASDLGADPLRRALEAGLAETLAAEVPAELRSRVGQTPLLPPESATRRLEARLVGAATSARPGDEHSS